MSRIEVRYKKLILRGLSIEMVIKVNFSYRPYVSWVKVRTSQPTIIENTFLMKLEYELLQIALT